MLTKRKELGATQLLNHSKCYRFSILLGFNTSAFHVHSQLENEIKFKLQNSYFKQIKDSSNIKKATTLKHLSVLRIVFTPILHMHISHSEWLKSFRIGTGKNTYKHSAWHSISPLVIELKFQITEKSTIFYIPSILSIIINTIPTLAFFRIHD